MISLSCDDDAMSNFCVRIDKKIKNIVRQVEANVMSLADCRALGPPFSSLLTDNILCVWYTNTSVCNMLAGSSLVCRQDDSWWQHGFVTSGVRGCNSETRPAINSNVVRHLHWIELNIGGWLISLLINNIT